MAWLELVSVRLACAVVSFSCIGLGSVALAIIASGIFGFDMNTTIIVTGLVVLVMSVTGGSWAVIASDFMQMVIIMAVTVTCAVVAIIQGGGLGMR